MRKKAKEGHLTQNDGVLDRREGQGRAGKGRCHSGLLRRSYQLLFGSLWQYGEA